MKPDRARDSAFLYALQWVAECCADALVKT